MFALLTPLRGGKPMIVQLCMAKDGTGLAVELKTGAAGGCQEMRKGFVACFGTIHKAQALDTAEQFLDVGLDAVASGNFDLALTAADLVIHLFYARYGASREALNQANQLGLWARQEAIRCA